MNYAGKFDAKLSADGSGLHSQGPAHGHAHLESVTTHASHAPEGAIIVPDAQLLFNGDFKRTGVDLVLSRDDHELVLHDYFKGENRAALSLPNGAHLTGDLVNALTGHTEYAQADGSAAAGKVIGHVSKLTGTATATRNGVSIILNNGDNVEKGDVLQSGSDSTLGVTFIDGTVFGLSSNARMVLNEMVYDPNGSNNSSLLSLVAGTITFVAGETAKHGDMKVDTPVATMGIRGTAVLVEIDFALPGAGPEVAMHCQVLVEPDGTTGSYILFDKNTLTPIATVNQAGQQINIVQGQVSITNAPLPPDVQKLIIDVFSLKFTDNTNTKTFDHFTDFGIPQSLQPIQLANGATATPIIVNVPTTTESLATGQSGPPGGLSHIPGAPAAAIQPASSYFITELAGKTGDTTDFDSVSGKINFADTNAGDLPTVSSRFESATYTNAAGTAIANLNPQQLADIAAVELKLSLTPAPGNKNNGSVGWVYNDKTDPLLSVSDSAFDFLAAGEKLTLTYSLRVDNNFALNDEHTTLTFTIEITGTNDVPVITTGPQFIAFLGGTSVPGGNLSTADATSGTLAFTDVDLTDSHTVATKLANATLSGPGAPTLDETALDALAPAPMAAFANALSATIAGDSTGTGSGTVHWSLADLSVYLADFIPKGETLTLTYAVTVTDSQNATSTQYVTVTLTGTDAPAVVWIATTKPGSPAGGLWNDAANWETGTVPIATDDAIIITNQLIGLTPSYPVTIDFGVDAVAKTVTMNDFSDFGNAHPELVNFGSLTIGGTFSLSVDSMVDNSGTLGVGGKMEVLDSSVLQNSGFITLSQGGDFKNLSSITNSGTIEVTGGNLDIEVAVANYGGRLIVDAAAGLILKGATISGGTITDNATIDVTGNSTINGYASLNNGAVTVESGIQLTLDDVTVSGTVFTDTASGATLAVDSGHALTLQGGAKVIGGNLLDAGTVHIEVGAELDGVGVSGGGAIIVDSMFTLLIQPAVPLPATLTLLDGMSITGGTLTIGSVGTLEIAYGAAGAGATLVDVGVASFGALLVDVGTTLMLDSSTVTGGAVTNHGVIDLAGSVLKNGSFDNGGTLNVCGTGNALDHETVTTNHALEVMAGAALLLDLGTTIANAHGTITVDAARTSPSLAAAILTLNGATITGGALTNRGTVNATGTSAIDDSSINNYGLIEATGGVLTIDPALLGPVLVNYGTLEANGGELDITGEPVTNTGTLQAIDDSTLKLAATTVTNTGGSVTAAAGSTLDLAGATISGGTLSISGTLDSTGTSALSDVAVANHGLIEATGGVLTVGSAVGATLTNFGTLQADGGELDITGAPVTNTGTLQAIDDSTLKLSSTTVTNSGGTVTVASGSTLDLVGATIDGGTLGISGTLDSTGISALTDVAITNHGLVEATGGLLTIDPALAVVLTNFGTLQANGGELDITGEPVINTGILQAIDDSTLKLTSTTVTDSGGTVTVGSGSMLDLVSATIDGGTIGINGTLDSTGTSAIMGAIVNNAGTLESTGGTLTIDAASTVNNTGLFEVNGGNLIVDTSLSGNAEIIGASLLELGAAAAAAYASASIVFAAAATGTLKLDHAETFNGTVAGLDDNKLDLGDITSGSNTSISYAGDASGGILTVISKTDPTQVAHIHLTGDYLGSGFVAAGDGLGGTSVTEVPGLIAGLDPHGNAVEGNALTALITDGGHDVTQATYQWQLDGHNILNATGAAYVPTEGDEGHALSVNISFLDALNHAETGTVSAGIVADRAPDITATAGSASGTASGTNLVVNGGFETGNFSGWTQSGNTGFTIVASSDSHSGTYDALLGPVGSDGHLSQNISTVAGEHYTLDFWLALDGGIPNDFSVTWNGTTLLPQFVNAGGHGYTEYSYDVVGAGPGSALQFNFREDPTFWHLDDVSLKPSDAADGTISFSDPGDTLTASFTPAASGYLGTFSLGAVSQVNGTGSVDWHFTTGGDNQQFFNPAAGHPVTQLYNVAISDGHAAGTVVETVGLTVGSSASDTFVFAPGMGQEMVFNFSQASGNADHIELDQFGISSFAQLSLQSTNNNHDTLINLGHNDSLLVVGVNASSLHAGDFILHA